MDVPLTPCWTGFAGGVTLLDLLNCPHKRSGDSELRMDASLAPAGLSVLQEEKGQWGWWARGRVAFGFKSTHSVSSWRQGLPGNTGLPGQPGLTAELVGTGRALWALCSPLPGTFSGPSLPVPAPLAAVGALFLPSCKAWRSQGGLWLPTAPSDPISPRPPSPHLPEPSHLVSCRGPYQSNSTSLR